MKQQGDIAVVGLAVMGQNLLLNMDEHGYTVVAYNRDNEFAGNIEKCVKMGKRVIGAHTIEEIGRA